MNGPRLLRRFDATLDWLTAVTPEGALDEDESQSFYSSRRPNPFKSKRRLRQRFDDESPRIRIIHERILKPVGEVTIGDNVQDCLSDMTYIEHEVVDEEEDKPLSRMPQKKDIRGNNRPNIARRKSPKRDIERPWTPDSSSASSSCSFELDNNDVPTRRKPCTNQSCREARWCGLKHFPRRYQKSPSSVSSRRKDYGAAFIRDAISLQKDTLGLSSENRMEHNIHQHHPVRRKEFRHNDEECENRQESLRQRRRKRLSVSIDLPDSDPVYSPQNTPVEASPYKALNVKRVSEHIRKFGECMDPNSDLAALSIELQNSLWTSASEGELRESNAAYNAKNGPEIICGTADDAGNSDVLLFNDKICTYLTGTLTTALDRVNSCFHRHSFDEKGRVASPYILPETSEEMRWSMTQSQIDAIWGDEGSTGRLTSVVSSDDRRDGKETFAMASPKSNREQPPQYPSTYFDYVKIKDIPFAQGMDVTVVPTCYIATPVETQLSNAERKSDDLIPRVSSADVTAAAPYVQGDDTRAKALPKNKISPKIEKQTICTNENTSPNRSSGDSLQLNWSNNASKLLSREVSGNNGEETSNCWNSDRDGSDGRTIAFFKSKSESMLDHLGQSTIQDHLPVSALSDTDALGKLGDSSVTKNAFSQNVPEASPLQDKSTEDISCRLNIPAMDDSIFKLFDSIEPGFASHRDERTPGFSSEPPAPHVDRLILDSQENPSDLWDGEIEFFGHASVSSRRQRKNSNKYASAALRELSQLSSGEENDNASPEKENFPDLTRMLFSSSGVGRPIDSFQLAQDANTVEDESRSNEEAASRIDAPVCAKGLTGDDMQDMEHIEVVHVEEIFDQGDFFQQGGANGIIFAVFNADYADRDYAPQEGDVRILDNVASPECSDTCSMKECGSIEESFEPHADDASESFGFDADDYPATFLGVIPGRLSVLAHTELSSTESSKMTTADHESDAKPGIAFEVPARRSDSECSGSHSDVMKLQSAILDDAKHLTEETALSLVQPHASASSVLFFKPTINVFGGESGANNLAALTRAFSKVPDASSGISNREKSLRTSFEIDLEAKSESKARRRSQESYCDNDDDSFTKELSRLATSERLLRKELESFQRRHSQAKTIIDLSMIDDSQCADSATTSAASNYRWTRRASTSRDRSTTQPAFRGVRDSDRKMDYSTTSCDFTSRFNRKTRSGILGSRFTTPPYSRQSRLPTRSYCPQPVENGVQRAQIAGARNNDVSYKESIEQLSRAIDPINCCDETQKQENSKISLLRSRLDQKRSALRSAIDMQRGTTHVDYTEQEHKQESSHSENDERSVLDVAQHESIEETKAKTEKNPVDESKAYFSKKSPKVAGSSLSSNSSKTSSLIEIDDSPPVSLSKSLISSALPRSSHSVKQLESAFRGCSESTDNIIPRTQNFHANDSSREFPQVEVALSPISLEFTTEMGFTFKGVELSSFNSYSTSGARPDASIDGSGREKEVEVTLSPEREGADVDTDKDKSSFSGSKSSSYVTLSDDSSSFRIYASDESRQLSQRIIPPGLISSNSTTSSLSLQEHLPVFSLREESSGSLSSRLSLPSVDSSKAEQILISYREAQHYWESQSERVFPVRSTPLKSTNSSSRPRLVRFDLPLSSETTVSTNIPPDIDDRKDFPQTDYDVVVAPFITSLSTGEGIFYMSDTRADPPGCLEKDPDNYLSKDCTHEVVLEPPFPRFSGIKPFSAAVNSQVKNEEVRCKKKAPSKPPQLKLSKAPREIQISVPSKNIYLGKLKASKDLRKSLLLGHKKKSRPTV